MTERAIDRLLKIIDSDEMTGEENANILWRKLRREVRRLAQEEKSHKAEAPASLVEEMREIADRGVCVGFKDLSVRGVIRELLKRHPCPTPQADNALVDRVKYEASLFAEMPTGTMDDTEYSRTKGIAQGLYKAVEIIAKFEGGVK